MLTESKQKKEVKEMTDSKKFKDYMKERGYTVKTLAEQVGISHESLYQKIGNERAFKATEIMRISEILGMSTSDRDEIFFAADVC